MPARYADLAHQLADAARAITLKHFRHRLEVHTKDDGTPVSEADRDAEAAMRAIIDVQAPDHGIWGEEHGRREGEWMWLLDPIDGTKAFLTGSPLFATVISLLHRGSPVLGVIDVPALDRRWSGWEDECWLVSGGHRERQRLDGSGPVQLAHATCAVTCPPMSARMCRLVESVSFVRWGGDATNYPLVASGLLHLAADEEMQPYDYLAAVPIARGAGAAVSTFAGTPPNLDSDGSLLVAANADLLAATVERVK